MPFNLRGGRPKNMGQGIYWVQRERDAGRRRSSSFQKAQLFDSRYSRITRQFLDLFQSYAGPNGTIEVITDSKLDVSLDRYNDIKGWIDTNIDTASHGDLSKLATAAKNILVEIAKREEWPHRWDASTKELRIKNMILDFS